uniref:Coiled-coil domain-containing protein 86 n=1 Tax=Nyssomyia neivai TaxID=330878 RepID=A0A1L8DXB7_9DIPT
MGRTKKTPTKGVKAPEVEETEEMETELSNDPDAKVEEQSEKKVGGKKKTDSLPRGVPKSGRVWKTQKQKFSTIKKSLNRGSFEKKEQLRQEMKQVKELSRSIKEQKKNEKEQQKLRREENERRKLENQQKSEIVQIIKNPAKLKRIRKKQLRMIEKRDLSKVKAI